MNKLLNMLNAYVKEIQFEGGTLRRNSDNQFIYEKDGKQKIIDFIFQKYNNEHEIYAYENFFDIYNALSEKRKGIVIELKENKGFVDTATYDDVYKKIFEHLNKSSEKYLIKFQYFMKKGLLSIVLVSRNIDDSVPEEIACVTHETEYVYIFSLDNKWSENLKIVWYGNNINKINLKLSEKFKTAYVEEFV